MNSPPSRVVYGAPCERCGHRRSTVFVGLPEDVAAMLREAVARSGLSKAGIARSIGYASSGPFHSMLAGRTRPSRPVARDLAVVLGLSWADGERLLAASGSERDRRGQRPG